MKHVNLNDCDGSIAQFLVELSNEAGGSILELNGQAIACVLPAQKPADAAAPKPMLNGAPAKVKLPPPPPPSSNEPLLSREAFLRLESEEQVNIILGDYAWAHDCLASGILEQYKKQCVAVSGQRILGVGKGDAAFRAEMAEKYNLHPEQMAVVHVWDEDELDHYLRLNNH